MEEYNVTQWLPDHGKRVLCLGHHTHCCKEDMDEEADWHEVTFTFEISSYKLKKEVPQDPEESILEYYKMFEHWRCGEDFCDGFVIGVTKWKVIT
jgi:hypothetical protein